MNFRTKALHALAFVTVLSGCRDSVGPSERRLPLSLTTSESGDPTAAIAKLDNGAGLTLTAWSSTGTSAGVPTQATYLDTRAGVRQRVIFGADGLPTATFDEGKGTITRILYSTNRIDFWNYDANRQYVSGTAVTYVNGKLELADVASRPVFNGQLRGVSNVVSFSALAVPGAGLGTPVEAPAGVTNYFRPLLETATGTAAYNRTLLLAAAMMMSSAPTTSANIRKLDPDAPAATVQTSQRGIPVVFAFAAAATIWAAYIAYKGTDAAQDNAFGLFDKVLENDVSATQSSPIDRLKDSWTALKDKLTLPTFTLPTIDKKLAAEKIRDAIKAASELVVPSGTPPAGGSSVTGVAVDRTNTTYNVSGTITGGGDLTLNGQRTDGKTLTVTGKATTTTFTGTYSGTPGTGAITGTVAPLGQCQTQTISGGAGTFASTYDMGASVGTVAFTYEAFSIPDAFQVIVNDATVVSTGMVSNSSTTRFALNGSRFVTVVVSAPQSGTAWNFTLGCP